MRFIMLLLMVLSVNLYAEKMVVAPGENRVEVVNSTPDRTELKVTVASFDRKSITINGKIYWHLSLPNESHFYDKGEPALPKMTRSLVINDRGGISVQVLESKYTDYSMAVEPSKGAVSRTVDWDKVSYTFGPMYSSNAAYPPNNWRADQPYILRELRGLTLDICPFTCNPVTGNLRVYTNMTIVVQSNSEQYAANENLRAGNQLTDEFIPLYKNHFLNFDQTRYSTVTVRGRMIVICPSSYTAAVQPLVDWKRQKGLPCDVYTTTQTGSTATAIKAFIQAQYNLNTGLAYVLLVGDYAQVTCSLSGGGGSDPTYSLLAGSDYYPDLFVGRFSAETTAQVTTQVNRTIYYERDITGGTWLNRGMCISDNASTLGDDNETDQAHMNNIRSRLLGYTYAAVDQIYDPSATAAQVSNNLNAGRSIINYIGHGDNTYWVTTGFSNTNVAALTNDNQLPFIFDVACVNGNFTGHTCFAEAWLRSQNTGTGNPIGAVACYASSINQTWDAPMDSQDESNRLLVTGGQYTFGGLTYNGSCHMLDSYGHSSSSEGTSMFLTWHIFGDPSLWVRTQTPISMTPQCQGSLVTGQTTVTVTGLGRADALVSFYQNSTLLGSGYTNSQGQATITLNAALVQGSVTLTCSASNCATVVQNLAVTTGIWAGPTEIALTVADNMVHLSWASDAMATSYTVEQQGADGVWTVLAQGIGANSYSFASTQTSGFYRVKAVR